MNIKKYVSISLALAIIGGLSMTGIAIADTYSMTSPHSVLKEKNSMMRGPKGMIRPAIIGTVSTISANIITVNGKQFSRANATSTATTTNVTYAVDTTNAKITKNGTTITISGISVGDTVTVQGTITGTSVAATSIRDGALIGKESGDDKEMMGGWKTGSTTPIIQGNGQPIVAGIISAISSTTLTVTNKSNVVYTVNVANAKIAQGGNIVTVSSLTIGDSVIVQGTVNGTSIVASSVIDQKIKTNSNDDDSATSTKHMGFFGGLGNFFAHLFGF